MARTKKVADSAESANIKQDPCHGCKYAPYDKRKQACKTCIRNKENG